MLAAKSHQNNMAGVEDEILQQANLFLLLILKRRQRVKREKILLPPALILTFLPPFLRPATLAREGENGALHDGESARTELA